MKLDARQQKARRHRRIRAKISGTAERPRISVFRSNKHVYAQLIDDNARVTIAAASDAEVKKSGGTPIETAREVGKLLAKRAGEKTIKKALFDRSGYKYHGNVKAIADGAREGGLEF